LIKDDRHRSQLRQLVVDRLLRCTTHRLQPIQEAAKALFEKWKIGDANAQPPFRWNARSTELFDLAVHQHYPLLLVLQKMQAVLLENDQEFLSTRPYFISLDVKTPNAQTGTTLSRYLNDFLESSNTVLAIEGAGGAGKSLGIKDYAARLLETYTEEGYFPVFVSLPRLTEPMHAAVDETFQQNNVGVSIEGGDLKKALSNRKTLWIFDAYDEITLEKFQGNNLNFFSKNNLNQLGRSAKIIFLYRTGALVNPDKVFDPPNGQLQKLAIEPFDESKIVAYLDRFYDLRQGNPAGTENSKRPMTKQQYLETFTQLKHTRFWEFVTNPLRLRISAETLPMIAETRAIDPKNLFQGQELGVIENMIFSSFAVYRALRAAKKMDRQYPIEAVDFLTYLSSLANAMEYNGGVKLVHQDLNGEIDSKFKDYFADIITSGGTIEGVPKRFLFKELEQGQESDGRRFWKFMHPIYQTYFSNLYIRRPTLQEKQQLIDDTLPKEKFKALFGVN